VAGRTGARTAFTTTPPTGSPIACSSATPSIVSCTGISSSSVHRCTAVCGERRTAITPSDWLLSGPTLARPPISLLMFRKRTIRPVGGPSSTTAS
jgi:hypothetical protein